MTERGVRDNTILIYMTDNGTSRGENVYNAGMRGKKGSGYDGGHRTICFFRWPDGDFGEPRTVDYASSITDILPTLADLLDFKIPETRFPFDGVSLQPVLRQPEKTFRDRKLIVQFGSRHRPTKFFRSCVVYDHWRLNGEGELYDIKEDPGQENDVSDKHPELTKELRAFYDDYWASIEESIDVIEPLVVGHDAEPSTVLTSNNWVEVDCDNMRRVSSGKLMSGIWQIEVEKSGRYKIELARWPFHLNRELTGKGPDKTIGGMPISPGVALPIASGSISVDGEKAVMAASGENNKLIEFEIELSAGDHTLQGWFHDASGKKLSGAFYGRVTKL